MNQKSIQMQKRYITSKNLPTSSKTHSQNIVLTKSFQSIEERITKFKWRSSLNLCLPLKSIKHDIKIKICRNHQCSNVVLTFENFFSYVDLFGTTKFLAVGTVMRNRKNASKFLKI